MACLLIRDHLGMLIVLQLSHCIVLLPEAVDGTDQNVELLCMLTDSLHLHMNLTYAVCVPRHWYACCEQQVTLT